MILFFILEPEIKDDNLLLRKVFKPVFDMMNKNAIREKAVDNVAFVNVCYVFFSICFQFSCYIGKIRVDKVADSCESSDCFVVALGRMRNMQKVGFEALDRIAENHDDFH